MVGEIWKSTQYSRRDCCEIVGISRDIIDDNIEEECIKVLKAAKAKAGNRYPTTLDIQAAHRKGKKGTVIIKFVNRKFAAAAMKNRSNLKESLEYKNTYLNQSLCPEFSFLNYAVRMAKRNGEIHYFKLKYGVTMIQKEAGGSIMEISHINDLSKYGLTVPDRSY